MAGKGTNIIIFIFCYYNFFFFYHCYFLTYLLKNFYSVVIEITTSVRKRRNSLKTPVVHRSFRNI